MSFLRAGPVSDGTVSTVSYFNPSKPFLLYATLSINHVSFLTLIDTGASATCISSHALEQLSNVSYVDRSTRSFILADGVIPLHSTGLVELSMMVNSECIRFQALVTEKLCIDLIIGMDFMIAFRANIDVFSQRLSLQVTDRQVAIPLDDQLRRPLVPIHATHSNLIPPHSTANVQVSSSISSLSAYFIPSSSFLEHPSLSSPQKTITFQNFSAWVLISNRSSVPQRLPQNFCFGYLLSNQARQQQYFDQLSALCRQYNEKKNQQLSSHGRLFFQPAPPPSPMPSSHIMGAVAAVPPSPARQAMDLLVKHLSTPAQHHQLSSLLNNFLNFSIIHVIIYLILLLTTFLILSHIHHQHFVLSSVTYPGNRGFRISCGRFQIYEMTYLQIHFHGGCRIPSFSISWHLLIKNISES